MASVIDLHEGLLKPRQRCQLASLRIPNVALITTREVHSRENLHDEFLGVGVLQRQFPRRIMAKLLPGGRILGFRFPEAGHISNRAVRLLRDTRTIVSLAVARSGP